MELPYPLYDELFLKANDRKEKHINVMQICTTINNISQTLTPEEAKKHLVEIAGLILHHEITTNGGILLSLVPYDGKVMIGGKGILHNMMNFPPILQQIIAQYIEESSQKLLVHGKR